MRLLLGLLLALVAPAQAAILNDGFEARMAVTDWVGVIGPKDGATSGTATVTVDAGGSLGMSAGSFAVGDFPTTPGRIVGVEFRISARASHEGIVMTGLGWDSVWLQDLPPFLSLASIGASDAESPMLDVGGPSDLAATDYIGIGGYGSIVNNENRYGLTSANIRMRNASYWTDAIFTAPGYPGNPLLLSGHSANLTFASISGYNATVYVDAVDVRLHYMDSSTTAMTGSGTMTATVQKMVPITAAMSGGGTMAATANAKRVIAANMVGSGKLSPVISRSSGGITYHHFMPELSGSGTMTVALSRYAGVSAAMTGGGTMDVLAHRAHGINAGAPVAMTGKGTMAVAVGVLRPITAAMAGSGTFAAAVAARRPVAAAMSGSGTMTAAMIVHRAVQAAMSGSGTLTAVIQRILGSSPVTAAMEGSGTMTASAGVLRAVAAAMVGSGTLDATVQVNTRLPAPEGRRFRVPNDALAFIVPDDFQTFEAQE